MSGGERDERVVFRADTGLVEDLDAAADAAGVSRSEILRRFAHFGLDTQADSLAREGEIKSDIEDIISDNQTLRKVVPSKWRAHIRRLFRDDLRDDTAPGDMKIIASGYRRQADRMEDLAAEIPEAPDADLVGIVDEELRHALEAADLSNWYDAVENPHERHLAGVEDGKAEREDVVALVQGVVDVHEHLAAAFDAAAQVPAVDADDLPPMAGSMLPDDVTRQDVADLATRLVRAEITAEQVPEVIPTVDPGILPSEVDSDVLDDGDEPAKDVEPATITMGGQPVDMAGQDDDEQPDADDGPQVVEASETTQNQLRQALAAADGGRHPDAVAPAEDSVEDSDMNPTTTDETDAEQLDQQIEDVQDELDALDVSNAATVEGGETDE